MKWKKAGRANVKIEKAESGEGKSFFDIMGILIDKEACKSFGQLRRGLSIIKKPA